MIAGWVYWVPIGVVVVIIAVAAGWRPWVVFCTMQHVSIVSPDGFVQNGACPEIKKSKG